MLQVLQQQPQQQQQLPPRKGLVANFFGSGADDDESASRLQNTGNFRGSFREHSGVKHGGTTDHAEATSHTTHRSLLRCLSGWVPAKRRRRCDRAAS